jgi:RNA polymerase sigma factor (TIGR02999 family)
MQEAKNSEITLLLNGPFAGDQVAEGRVISLLYKDLRRLANHYLANERHDHTLQPTALVHEAFMRLSKSSGITWRNRGHFFAVAARQMRRILVDYARYRNAGKRPGIKVSLELADVSVQQPSIDILAIHEALSRLAERDPRQAQIVELRFFGGLSHEEIATVLDLSLRTVKRDWNLARVWLYAELTKATPHGDTRALGAVKGSN